MRIRCSVGAYVVEFEWFPSRKSPWKELWTSSVPVSPPALIHKHNRIIRPDATYYNRNESLKLHNVSKQSSHKSTGDVTFSILVKKSVYLSDLQQAVVWPCPVEFHHICCRCSPEHHYWPNPGEKIYNNTSGTTETQVSISKFHTFPDPNFQNPLKIFKTIFNTNGSCSIIFGI